MPALSEVAGIYKGNDMTTLDHFYEHIYYARKDFKEFAIATLDWWWDDEDKDSDWHTIDVMATGEKYARLLEALLEQAEAYLEERRDEPAEVLRDLREALRIEIDLDMVLTEDYIVRK